MLEGSSAKFNWRLFNHKKHLVIFTTYVFFARTFDLPYSGIAFTLMVVSLIRDGIKHGRRQIKETEPNYMQVVQPVFLGLMVAIYLGLVIRIYQGALSENELEEIPRGSAIVYFFLFILFCMALIFFPLIVSSMISFLFFLPYFFGFKFGKYYSTKARSLKPDEMRNFLADLKTENLENELPITKNIQ